MATWTFEKRPGAPAGTIGIDLQGVGTPGAPDFAIDDTPGATIVTSDPVAAFALLRESYLRLQGVDSGPSPSTPVERRVVTVDGVLHELAPDGTATTIPVEKTADLDTVGHPRRYSGDVIVGEPSGTPANNTAMLRAAIVTARSRGARVVLQAGRTYIVDGDLDIEEPASSDFQQKPVRIYAEGSHGFLIGTATPARAGAVIQRAAGYTGSIISGRTNGLDIEGITFDGNSVPNSAPVVDIARGFELRLHKVRVMAGPGGGLHLRALSNPRLTEVTVQTCGTDGLLAGTPGAAAAMLIEGSVDSEAVSNTVTIEGLHLERNNGVDLLLGVGDVDGGQSALCEFVHLIAPHIEANIDNTGYADFKEDPCLWVGNVMGLDILAPQFYGGHGPMIRVQRTYQPAGTVYHGVSIVGGDLSGRKTGGTSPDANTPDYLVDLVAGDRFSMRGTRLDNAMIAGIRVRDGFGSQVELSIPDIVQRTGGTGPSATTTVVDERTTTVRPLGRNKSIGGTGVQTLGGSVRTLDSNGNARNHLDDGSGNATIAGQLTVSGVLLPSGGLRYGTTDFSASGTLSGSANAYRFTGSSAATLTLPASTNLLTSVTNAGTAALTIAAPSSGSAPSIDGAASISLHPGEAVWLIGRSSSIGYWSVLGRSLAAPSLCPTPTLVTAAAMGTTPPTPNVGSGSNDLEGYVMFGSGSSPAAGKIMRVNFGVAMAAAPKAVLLTNGPYAAGSYAAPNGYCAAGLSTSGFDIAVAGALGASVAADTYRLTYRVIR